MTPTAASRFVFERLERRHVPLLERWLAEPHVARWWDHDPSPEGIEADFGASFDGTEPGKDYVVLLDGEPIGLMQLSKFSDYPDYAEELEDVYPVGVGAATIDYLVGDPGRLGKGTGTAMIDAFVRMVPREDPSVTYLVVPVNSDNRASWRALEKAGFRRVARGELDPDNPTEGRWHEVLRFDLVAQAELP